MKTYMIGYDLHAGQNYAELEDAIKNLGNWWHCLDSTWLVKSNATAEQIRNVLQMHIHSDDRLLVVQLIRDAAWTGFTKQCADWLRENL